MFSIYSFGIINVVVLDSEIFFWIDTSVSDIAADTPNGIKTILSNGANTFSINGETAIINRLRKLRNPPPWLLIFLVVPFNKIPPFHKDLITVIYFLLNLSVPLSRKYFSKSLAISFPLLARFDKIGMSRRTPPKCAILDYLGFENFMLSAEPFAKSWSLCFR